MRRAAFLLLIAGLAAAPAPAQGTAPAATPRLESLVPDGTFLLASLNDVPAGRAQLSRTALAKLWREPEVQEFLGPALDLLRREVAKAERRLGYSISGLLDLFAGQAALAVVEFDPLYAGMVPDAVLLADVGEKKDEVRQMLLAAVEKAGPGFGSRKLERGGVPYEAVALPLGLELCVAYLGNAVVVTTRRDRMTQVIDAYAGKIENPLSASPTYRKVTARTGGRSAFASVFLNTQAILGYFGDRLDAGTRAALDASGLTGIQAVGLGSSFAGEGVRDTVFVYVPGEKKGLLRLAYTSPGDGTALLSRVPRTAFYAAAGRVDLDEVVGIVLETLGRIDPSAAARARTFLGEADRVLGLSLRADLLKPFGEEMAIYAALPDGGGIVPDLVFLTRLREPERFVESIVHLAERARGALEADPRLVASPRKMEFGGRTIYYFHVAQRWGDPIPVTPSFVVDGDVCAMALFPQTLKDFVARGADGPSILDRPDFRRVRQGLPEGLASIEYVDLQAAARLIYGTLAPLAQALGKHAKVPVDVALLPRTETIAKHLSGGAWGAKVADDGLEFHALTPCGFGPLLLGMAAPVLLLAREGELRFDSRMAEPPRPRPGKGVEEPAPPPAESGREKLEAIYTALLFYLLDKDEGYPGDLGALVTSKVLPDRSVLLLEGDASPLAVSGGQRTSFVYVGPEVGALVERQGEAVWVYEREGLSEGPRWVLFADGTVRRVPEEELAKLLAATRKRIGR